MNKKLLKNLSPANFAFVMSTGVVSIIFHRTDWYHLSMLFLIIGLIGYVALVALFLTRIFVLKMEVLQDFKDIKKMFKYFTFSAGSNALAASLCLFGYNEGGLILGSIGVISTILLTYTLFCTFFFHNRVSIQTISPFWLLLAIACNSSGIVITALWNNGVHASDLLLLLAFGFWSFGVFVYLIFMTLNILRMVFYPFNGPDMDPCYWTCMGAAAIAVVDGSQFTLLHNFPQIFDSIKPFMEGMVLFLWVVGTALIPFLCLMELWKYFYFKVPFDYQPSRWAMVFPLAMYTAATDLLSFHVRLGFFQEIAHVWVWITFFMWCLVAFMSRMNPFEKNT